MLDLTLKYFSYHSTTLNKEGGRLFGYNVSGFNTGAGVQNRRLAIPRYDSETNNTNAANKYTTDISINIITGIGWQGTISVKNRMDTSRIYSHLTSPTTNALWRDVLVQKNNFFDTNDSGISLVRIIGGKSANLARHKYNVGSLGYYGSNYGQAWNETDNEQSEGWQWDIDLSANNNLNKWPINNHDPKNYDLNNILWCSLRSPKKFKVRKITNPNAANVNEEFRFVTNFIDLSGTYSVGGGFGRDLNTIDIPRSTLFPYYSSSGGNDCVSINKLSPATAVYAVIELDVIAKLPFCKISNLASVPSE